MPRKKKRWTREKADKKAREIGAADPSFVLHPNVREWARQIGCGKSLVANLDFYKACRFGVRQLPNPDRHLSVEQQKEADWNASEASDLIHRQKDYWKTVVLKRVVDEARKLEAEGDDDALGQLIGRLDRWQRSDDRSGM